MLIQAWREIAPLLSHMMSAFTMTEKVALEQNDGCARTGSKWGFLSPGCIWKALSSPCQAVVAKVAVGWLPV